MPVLAEQLGLPASDAQPTLSGRRSVEITRAYVGAFFDLHLRRVPQPVLDGPTKTNPEVKFNNP
jgi:hypothetical protein